MKTRNLSWLLLPALAMSVAACEVEQTEEGKMPEVSVKDGQMLKYDVDVPDVNVKMEERTVRVPTVDIQSAEEGEQNAERAQAENMQQSGG